MKVLTEWLRSYVPGLTATDAEMAEALTLRGIAVEGVFDLSERFGPGAGSLFEMDITTNRVDAMNHYGIARELAVIYGLNLQPLNLSLPQPAEPAGQHVRVRMDDDATTLCGRFTARVLRNVCIAPSGAAVARRFTLLEQKQISNAVDATNYVTQCMGQPTHAFDLDKLAGGLGATIVVRRARAGERLRTLDGIERTLHPEDLVVADEEKALGLAGVMGGWDSRITEQTRNVLVEAAWFDPGAVRRMARRHGLHTDASHRFERGADFEAAEAASALVSQLILEAGGFVEGPFVDVVQASAEARTSQRPQVLLRMDQVKRILGPVEGPAEPQVSPPEAEAAISESEVTSILTGVGCGVSNAHDLGLQESRQGAPVLMFPSPAAADHSPNPARATEAPDPNTAVAASAFAVTLPSWRLDLEREIDLLEEVARVYGYNRFRNTLPAFSGSVHERPEAPALRVVRTVLRGAGYSEAISSTFASSEDCERFAPQPGTSVPIENPLSEEAGMLRPSLIPGMLSMLARNLHRGVDAALFELGTVFTGTLSTASAGVPLVEKVDERTSLAFGATGTLQARPVEFYSAKGLVEALAAQFTTRLLYFDRFLVESIPGEPTLEGLMPRWLHPGRSARLVVDGSTIGFFGQLHPAEATRRKLKQPIVLGELRLDRLLALGLRQPMPRELSRFQPVRRDFSFLLPASVPFGSVEQAVRALNIAELLRLEPIEVRHETPGMPQPATEQPAHYSLLLRTVFQSVERTLRDEELQTWAQAIQTAVSALGGRLRS